MSSWFSQTVSIDEMVERATSESLPTGELDWALNLEICDMIRSKTVNPKDAMRSLKRRLLNKNPNVQIATLHLVDICIKNGGSHFLIEVASREFMDSAVLALKPQSGTVNYDVKNLLLEYIQNWAVAFENQLQLNYVGKVYNQLKQEGYEFPSTTKLNSTFIDSSAPPEWVDSDTCMKSGIPFSFVNRKHHCRNCGGVFVQKHCQSYLPLPHYGINTAVRVCDDCNDKLLSKSRRHSSISKGSSSNSHASSAKLSTNNPFSQQRTSTTNDDIYGNDDDEELQRALKLSLDEANRKQAPVPAAAAPPTNHNNNTSTSPEEEDEDMKAAIAASLRDMGQTTNASNGDSNDQGGGLYQHNPQSPATTWGGDSNSNNATAAAAAANTQEDDFSSLEEEILYRYVHLVDSIQRAPPGAILKETKLQQLNDSVSALRPKLARTLGQTIDKYDRLVDMHGKLTTVVRFYDQLLEQRLSNNYKQHSISDYGYNQQPNLTPTGTGNTWYQQQPQQQNFSQPPPPVNTATHPQAYQPSAPPSAPPMANEQSDFEQRYPPVTSSEWQQQPQQQQQQQQYPPGNSQRRKPAEEPVLIEL